MLKSLLFPLVLIGCREASSAAPSSRATVSGHAQFWDVDLDRDGSHREVNIPAGQTGTLRVVVRGNGALESDCTDGPAGQFTAYYDGRMAIDGNGAYTAPLYPAAPTIVTPSMCAVRNVEVQQITDVEMAAELTASPAICRDLCDGRGRQLGEESCRETSDREACRTPIATVETQRCAQACLSSAASITGRGWLDGASIQAVGGDELKNGNLGELHAHITFDQMIDGSRGAVRE